MNFERVKTRLMRLPLYAKLITAGSFLSLLSVIMPWYEDLDAFKTGDMFLGITGPLYLAGFVILLTSVLSFGLMVTKIMDKKAPYLPMKENHVHIAVSVLNVFLLILVNSVYFHDKFGVNIALKDSRFGMTIAFIANVILLISSILNEKKRGGALEFEAGKLEPLIKMDDHVRENRSLHEQRETSMKVTSTIEKFATTDNKHEVRAGVRETLMDEEKSQANSNPQAWRMDL